MGADFEFVDDIFGGAIPRQYVPAIEKGIQDTRLRGYLAGFPVVDFRVTITNGSYHDVDSSEMAFRLAGRLAFRDGMTRARPTLLEPTALRSGAPQRISDQALLDFCQSTYEAAAILGKWDRPALEKNPESAATAT